MRHTWPTIENMHMVNRTANMPKILEIGSKTIPEHADVKLINANIVLNSV